MKRMLKRFCVFATVLVMTVTLGAGVFATEGVDGDPLSTNGEGTDVATAPGLEMTSVKKVSDSKCNITIEWQGDAASYVVYAENAKKGTTTNTRFVVKNLMQGNIYTLRVVPKNSDGSLGDEKTLDVLALFIMGSGKNEQVDLSWPAVEGETSYNVKAYNNSGQVVKEQTVGTNSASVTDLTNDVPYRFTVEAAGAISPMTAEITPKDSPESIDQHSVRSYPGYQSVTLEWEKVDDCEGYLIERSPKGANKFRTIQTENIVNGDSKFRATDEKGEYKSSNIMSYRDNNDLKEFQLYDYRIWAINGDYNNSPAKSERYVTATDECVHAVTYTFKFKTTVTLTGSKGSAEKKTKFTAGTTVTSGNQFYSGGYTYVAPDGYSYRVSRTVTTNNTIQYEKTKNYSMQTAYNFMNEAMRERPTSLIPFHNDKSKVNAIWTSFNTQHVYIYKRDSEDRWQIERDFECATGKPAAPSPTGWKLSIGQKAASRHGLTYWSCFSSWNAFHGKLASWPVGAPASGGCVRCEVPNAKYIYQNMPSGGATRVVHF